MNSKWVIKPLVPEEVYTDREEFLKYFHHAALEAAHRRTMSTVLLGQRRMGKTEIFKRVVNRLFLEQEPNDSNAVVPVYYSFREQELDRWEFSIDYTENFIRWYAAFHLRNPAILSSKYVKRDDFRGFLQTRLKVTHAMTGALNLLEFLQGKDVTIPEDEALTLPRFVSDHEDSTIVMFLDEFQNTRMPQYKFSISGFMQEAVESPTCPHFVTGSAMSILSREIIGRGALFGRFDGEEIQAMSEYYGAELALKAARYYKAEISEIMAPVTAERCGGNPFYITAVIRQAAKQGKKISDEEALNRIMAVDITSGFIWGELNDQVTRWITRINGHRITKWILYLSALDENTEEENRGRLNVERIQRELKQREGRTVPPDEIRDVLIKLSRGDLLEYMEMGGWFRRIKDPILLEFLKVWGKIEVEGHKRKMVEDDLKVRYGKLERRISEYKGYLAEVHMSQVLLNGQRKSLPGMFFNTSENIQIPDFTFVKHRYRSGSGKGREIDVLGAAGPEQWVCQSKWVKGEKTGISVLENLMSQADTVKEDICPRLVRMWIFAHDGLTREAEAFAKEHGILWSSRKEFDGLLEHLGLRKLPDL